MSRRRKNKLVFPRRYCPVADVECYDHDFQGSGLVKWNNKTFAIHGLIKGEIAKIIIYYEDQYGGEGRICKLIKVSPDRKLSFNDPKMELGSYQIAHLKNEAQDEWKQNQIEKLFPQAQKIIVGKREYYRNKVVIHNGGFSPPGKRRKVVIKPKDNQFDLMNINFEKYANIQGDIIIRRLETEIEGTPGSDIYTTDTMLGKKFLINLNSFYQVNTEMATKAYLQIIGLVKKDGIVLDLFSGIGVIGILVSDISKKVYCVEINKDSHKDALKNIELNKISNIEAINGDANLFVINFKESVDTIILDPARSGLNKKSMEIINNSKADRIIYLSCNIHTQKRDIESLTNYEISLVQPYDFFPQTYHIENLIILDIKKSS